MIRHAFYALAEGPHLDEGAADLTSGPNLGDASRPVAIRLRSVEKRFADNQVLRGIDLDVPAGQFLAIVGKSGCGKSTLLRLLVGLDQPSAGSIEFSDVTGREARPNARIVFQEPRLLPWAHVIDNVIVGLGEGVEVQAARREAMSSPCCSSTNRPTSRAEATPDPPIAARSSAARNSAHEPNRAAGSRCSWKGELARA